MHDYPFLKWTFDSYNHYFLNEFINLFFYRFNLFIHLHSFIQSLTHSFFHSITHLFFQEGDRVWFWKSLTGSSAEYCICSEDSLGVLPEASSFQEGAMIGTTYLTAHRALFLKYD